MKKNRFLIGVLVLALMLMGAGYAAWSQTFTVQATVNTGELALTVTAELDEDKSNFNGRYMDVIFDENNVDATTGDSEDGGDNTFTVDIENIYPGAKIVYKVIVTNDGTMPIKLDKQPINDNLSLGYDGKLDINVVYPGKNNAEPTVEIDINKSMTFEYTVTFNKNVGTKKDPDELENITTSLTHTYFFQQFNE
jgi:hypothetical protein